MRHHLGETWLDDESCAYNTHTGAATGSNRRGYVRFPDGKLRRVTLGVADTYFTIPAKPSHGRIGYVSVWESPDPPQREDETFSQWLARVTPLERVSEYRFHSQHWNETHNIT